jgi:hypothetical protein
MAGHIQKQARVSPNVSVFVEHQGDNFSTGGVCAFADERHVLVEMLRLGHLTDPLVRPAEDGVIAPDAFCAQASGAPIGPVLFHGRLVPCRRPVKRRDRLRAAAWTRMGLELSGQGVWRACAAAVGTGTIGTRAANNPDSRTGRKSVVPSPPTFGEGTSDVGVPRWCSSQRRLLLRQ